MHDEAVGGGTEWSVDYGMGRPGRSLASLEALALIRRAAPSVTVNINNSVNVRRKARGDAAGGAVLERDGARGN
jgi:hypothetical protein